MKALSLTLIMILTLPFMALAETGKTKIEDIAYKAQSQGSRGSVVIRLASPINEIPELTIKDNMVQVSVPGTFVWPKIEKNVSVGSADATLMAYQFNKDLVRVRAMLPFSLEGREKQVSLVVGDNSVELTFPVEQSTKTVSAPAPAVKSKKSPDAAYDTKYLEKLLSDKELRAMAEQANSKGNAAAVAPKLVQTDSKKQQDEVNVTLSAPEREDNAPFSVANYLGKFVAFLGVVLLVFYAAATLMKKGVLKKGKLGFLNSTKSVEVLSTTFIGPKRSVLTIRAHDQVFLVGSSESGLQLISEISNPVGMMKEGERKLAGDNFDTTLQKSPEKEFRLKETAQANREAAATSEVGLDSFLDSKATNKVKDKVRFSDQIKSKVKNLKPLQ
tara:strand:+ start:2320 stop:3480 length:1161 start_codon:yes stop_codon:yes gene_type:complete